MLERREVELQRHMDRLEEERKKEVDKYDKSMTDFQAHVCSHFDSKLEWNPW